MAESGLPLVLAGATLGHHWVLGCPGLQVLGLELLQLPKLSLQPLPVDCPQLLKLLHGKWVHVIEGDVPQLPGGRAQSARSSVPSQAPGPCLGEPTFQRRNGEKKLRQRKLRAGYGRANLLRRGQSGKLPGGGDAQEVMHKWVWVVGAVEERGAGSHLLLHMVLVKKRRYWYISRLSCSLRISSSLYLKMAKA